MVPPDDDESVLEGWDPAERTPLPEDLPPDVPSNSQRAESREEMQQRLDRVEVQRVHTRLTEIERRLHAIEQDPTLGKVDRMLRQWRYFRRYMVAWLSSDTSSPVDPAVLQRQWRRLRKYLAVWLREE